MGFLQVVAEVSFLQNVTQSPLEQWHCEGVGGKEGAFALGTQVCLYKISNCDEMTFWLKLSHLHNINIVPLTNDKIGERCCPIAQRYRGHQIVMSLKMFVLSQMPTMLTMPLPRKDKALSITTSTALTHCTPTD